MQYRINYTANVNETLRSLSIIIEAQTVEAAKAEAEKKLTQKWGKDQFRLGNVAPW